MLLEPKFPKTIQVPTIPGKVRMRIAQTAHEGPPSPIENSYLRILLQLGGIWTSFLLLLLQQQMREKMSDLTTGAKHSRRMPGVEETKLLVSLLASYKLDPLSIWLSSDGKTPGPRREMSPSSPPSPQFHPCNHFRTYDCHYYGYLCFDCSSRALTICKVHGLLLLVRYF
jgi:hypothetical protein